jgi:hypothetical protein
MTGMTRGSLYLSSPAEKKKKKRTAMQRKEGEGTASAMHANVLAREPDPTSPP